MFFVIQTTPLFYEKPVAKYVFVSIQFGGKATEMKMTRRGHVLRDISLPPRQREVQLGVFVSVLCGAVRVRRYQCSSNRPWAPDRMTAQGAARKSRRPTTLHCHANAAPRARLAGCTLATANGVCPISFNPEESHFWGSSGVESVSGDPPAGFS